MQANDIDLSKQHHLILAELRLGARTTLELQRATGVLSVSARMHELRTLGHRIDTALVTVRNRRGDRCHVARYTLTEAKRAPRRPAAASRKARRA